MTTFDLNKLWNLYLCADNNHGGTHNRICKTLSDKYRKGVYDHDRAVGYIERQLVILAAKECVQQEYEGRGRMSADQIRDAVKSTYPRKMRLQVAEHMANNLCDEFRLGNFYS